MSTVFQFMESLRRTQLLSPDHLNELDSRLRAQPPELETLASELVQRGLLTGFQVEQLLNDRGQDLVLGAYSLLEPLGKGGMGVVFKARHRHLDRVVALKVIRPDVLSGPDAAQRFRREARLAARLAHRHVVLVHDADQIGATYFYVMEYVRGVTLAQLLRSGVPLDVWRACDYVRQACLGLQHIHECGLVHRDLKPANLMLATNEGVVKILDLGLAFLAEAPAASEQSCLTASHTQLGTADYMAPEQGRDAHHVDIRADIYSLGCTLYCLLTGQPPFPGGTYAEKLLRHQQEEPRPVRELRPDVPPSVAAVLTKMMAKDPEGRHQTPAAVAAALEPFSDAKTAITMPFPRGPVSAVLGPGQVARRRLRLGAAIALFAGLCCLLWSQWPGGRSFPEDGTAGDAGLWLVTRKTNAGPHSFTTVRAALERAQPGDRILVQEEEHQEQLQILRGDAGKGVTILGAAPSGKPVVWRLPPGAIQGEPLLRLDQVEGLCLKHFVLDGLHQVEDLVSLSGNCPGVQLEDLHLRGFNRCAVRFASAAGVEDRPVLLRRVRTTTALPRPAALLFTVAAGLLPRNNHDIEVRDCRLEGPLDALVVLDAPVAAVRFHHNRFFRARDGFLVKGLSIDPRQRMDLAITSNTFCDLQGAALRVAGAALSDIRTSRVLVTDNLLARTATLAQAEGAYPAPHRDTRWIWYPADDPLGVPLPGARLFLTNQSENTPVRKAVWHLACDERFRVFCNGALVGESRPGERVYAFDITAALGNPRKQYDEYLFWCPNETGRAGFLAEVTCDYGAGPKRRLWSDAGWKTAVAGPSAGLQVPVAGERLKKARALAVGPLQLTDTIGNVCDGAATEGNLALKARPLRIEFRSLDPARDAAFLRYARTSPLAQAGYGKKPAGVPPE